MSGARRTRRGYTLVETIVAATLLGILATGVAFALHGAARAGQYERHRIIALQLARSELDLARAAGPYAAAAVVDTFLVSSTGARVADGTYQVEITADTRCDGGPQTGEYLAADTLAVDCSASGQRPTRSYTVIVRYRNAATGAAFGSSVTVTGTATGRSPAAGAYAPPST